MFFLLMTCRYEKKELKVKKNAKNSKNMKKESPVQDALSAQARSARKHALALSANTSTRAKRAAHA